MCTQLDELDAALTAARARGEDALRSVVNSDGMLTEDAAALVVDCSLENLRLASRDGSILGLPFEGRLFFPD